MEDPRRILRGLCLAGGGNSEFRNGSLYKFGNDLSLLWGRSRSRQPAAWGPFLDLPSSESLTRPALCDVLIMVRA